MNALRFIATALAVFQISSPQVCGQYYEPAGHGHETLRYSATGKLGQLLADTPEPTAAMWISPSYRLIYRERAPGGDWGPVEEILPMAADAWRICTEASLQFDATGTPHALVAKEGILWHYHRSPAGEWKLLSTSTPDLGGYRYTVSNLATTRTPDGCLHAVCYLGPVIIEQPWALGHAQLLNEKWTWEVIHQSATLTPGDLSTGFETPEQNLRFSPRNLSLAAAADGSLHVVFGEKFSSVPTAGGTEQRSSLFHATNAGGTWVATEVISPGAGYGDAGIGASLAVAPDGTVAVAATWLPRVQTGSPGSAVLKYLIRQTNGTWTSQDLLTTADNYSAGDGPRGSGLFPSLIFDAQNRPHIVCCDHASEHFPMFGAFSFSGQMRYLTRAGPSSGPWSVRTLIGRGAVAAIDHAIFEPVVASAFGELAVSALVYQWDGTVYQKSFRFLSEGVVTVPDLIVEHPAQNRLVDGGSIIEFGSVTPGTSSSPKTFTLRNGGTAPLTGIAVTTVGPQNSDFAVVSAGMATTLAPGASTGFSIVFTPGAAGVRSGLLRIVSNFNPENPFEVWLSGAGTGVAATTGGASGVTDSSATLNGTVNPGGLVTTAWFEYGQTAAYGSTAAVTLAPDNGTSLQQVSADITGLLPRTTYHYRLTAANSGGSNAGIDRTFTTVALPPAVVTGAATGIMGPTATLNGTVNPNGETCTARFEYGLTTAYGDTAAVTLSPENGTSAQAVSVSISGLQLGRTYHYRLTAAGSAGSGTGEDLTFATAVMPPLVATGNASEISATGATISGTVNPLGLATTARFEYGLTAAYGSVAPVTLAPDDGSSGQMVSATLSGLLSETTYHYRLIATNSAGTSPGLDLTFKTGVSPYAYTVANGTITIIDYRGPGGAVVIPAEINGLPVTGIGYQAFFLDDLTSITIPAGVTTIQGRPFYICTSLTEMVVDPLNTVYSSRNGILFDKSQATLIQYPRGKTGTYTIPNTVTRIADGAFGRCASLAAVTIPPSVTEIGSWAFEDCTSLTGITIPASVTIIERGAFYGCSSLTTVTIPPSVTKIGSSAFAGCNSLTSVTIPASVADIGSWAFSSCTSLTEITVAPSNAVYSSLSGVLFDKHQATLIQYPGGKTGSYTIPGTVTRIADGAFEDCASLTAVTIPASVTEIGSWAFAFCGGLSRAIFMGNAPLVGEDAFDHTAGDFAVYFLNNKLGFTSPTWQGYPAIGLADPSPVVTTGPATGIEMPAATLHGTVNPQGLASTAWFEYGLTAAYGNTANVSLTPNNGSGGQAVSATISGLQPGATYHYRLTATNSGGTTSGADLTFATPAPATPSATWLLANGFPADTNLLSDPNGDGVSLLLAYAFNLNPALNLSGSMPRPVITADRMNFTFYAGNADVNYLVETSNDLSVWSTVGVTLSAADAGGLRTATFLKAGPSRFMRLRSVIKDSAYGPWRTAGFSTAELADAGVSGDLADPDLDGLPNLLEYAMAGRPKAPDTNLQPATGRAGGYLTLTYRQSKAATDLAFMPQATANPNGGIWSAAGLVETDRVDCGTYWLVTVRDAVPIATVPNRFMRLTVSH